MKTFQFDQFFASMPKLLLNLESDIATVTLLTCIENQLFTVVIYFRDLHTYLLSDCLIVGVKYFIENK